MRWFIFALLLALPVQAETLTGKPRFLDADTLKVAGVAVRLFGIDAPELDQTCLRSNGREWACGKWAADQARALFGKASMTCQPIELDPYGRTVARCFSGGVDVGETLVRQGLALAYRRYSIDYVAAEKAAAVTLTGIWEGTLVPPEDFRAAKAEARVTANQGAAPTGCVIKGNISKSGRIYHLPGQENYAKTMISEAKGEQWFCSESEARAAGWRKAER